MASNLARAQGALAAAEASKTKGAAVNPLRPSLTGLDRLFHMKQ